MQEQYVAALANDLGETAARGLVEHLTVTKIELGDRLVRGGQRACTLWFLVEGTLRATLDVYGKTLVLGEVSPGSWLGEVNLIDEGPATATVVALTDCTLLALTHSELVALRDDEPEVASALLLNLIRDLSARVRNTSAGMLERVNDGEFRVARPEAKSGWISGWLTRLLGGSE
jgi:CRP/FNR family transcriptional regulator